MDTPPGAYVLYIQSVFVRRVVNGIELTGKIEYKTPCIREKGRRRLMFFTNVYLRLVAFRNIINNIIIYGNPSVLNVCVTECAVYAEENARLSAEHEMTRRDKDRKTRT